MASELITDGKFVLVEDDPGVPDGASLLDPFAGLPEAVYKPWLLEYDADCARILTERLALGDYGCIHEHHDAHELEIERTLTLLFPDLSDDFLDEAKAHGTNKAVDSTRVRVRDVETNFNSAFTAAATTKMKSRATVARKGFNELIDKARNDITEMLALWRDEQLTFRNLQVDSAQLFRTLYEQVWELGRLSSGIHTLTPDAHTTDEERNWFRSALREELGYWQNFLLELRDHHDKDKPLARFTPAERVEMYLKTFEAIYDSARAFSLPSAVLIYWVGPGRNDPTTCLTGRNSLVTTNRGQVAIGDIRPGDVVLTHKGNWKRVLAVQVNRSDAAKKYAVVVGPNYELLGITQDHKVWTKHGWLTTEEAARTGTDVCHVDVGVLPSVRRKVSSKLLERNADAVGVPVSLAVGENLRADTGELCNSSQESGQHGRQAGKSEIGGVHSASQSARGGSKREGTGSKNQEGVLYLQEDVSGGSQESDSTLLFGSMSGQTLKHEAESGDVRNVRKENSAESITGAAGNAAVLLSGLLSEGESGGCYQDPAVCLLRKEFQEKKIADTLVHPGQVILLASVLPIGSDLYDITVEDDHSFVANGLMVHNCKGCQYIVERQPFTKFNLPAVPRSGATPCLGNCRHKLVVRKANPAQIAARQVALPNRETMVKALAEFTHRKKLRKPRGAGAAHALNPYARGSASKARGR